jgi:hypothetical protein
MSDGSKLESLAGWPRPGNNLVATLHSRLDIRTFGILQGTSGQNGSVLDNPRTIHQIQLHPQTATSWHQCQLGHHLWISMSC